MVTIYTTADGIAYATGDGSLLGFGSVKLVTDRTAADVARWKALHDKGWEAMTAEEREEWRAGMKGSYNHTDMNRVENAVRELAARFQKKGITLSLITKTDWTQSSWPTRTDMHRYFQNVAVIREAVGLNLGAPTAPTVTASFDYNKANDIEKILETVGNWMDRVEASQRYSGDLYLGEV